MQRCADIRNAGERQDVVIAEVDRVARGGGKERVKLGSRETGTVVGMRDIDLVSLDLAEIGDDDVTGIEHEFVGAAEPGQRVHHVAAAKATVEGVGAGVAGEIIAEMRSGQVSSPDKTRKSTGVKDTSATFERTDVVRLNMACSMPVTDLIKRIKQLR